MLNMLLFPNLINQRKKKLAIKNLNYITSHTKLINDRSIEVKLISTKGLTKDPGAQLGFSE